jgi:hypothetical protein
VGERTEPVLGLVSRVLGLGFGFWVCVLGLVSGVLGLVSSIGLLLPPADVAVVRSPLHLVKRDLV